MISVKHRFHRTSDVQRLYRHGQIVRAAQCSLRFQRTDRHDSYRLTVVVSKKVSKSAVVRNRIRRRTYEFVRTQADSLTPGIDMAMLIYDPSFATMPAQQLHERLAQLLYKAAIIPGK